MELLPRSPGEFGSARYWDRFFRQRGQRPFEWYGAFPELCPVLHKYIRPRDKVLVVGCGNSELSEQMYDTGTCEDIVNIDISDAVIRQMQERSGSKRPKMSYLVMDMFQMDFPDAEFQVVLDKGTLDAILTDEEEATLVKADKMFAEISRVLQGRETEWLFGMEEGRKQLAISAGFRRLVTVALHREQHYEDMAGIQAELSAKVMELAPPGLPTRQQVPFLSMGGDIGVRAVRHRGSSPLSGEYIVEDVRGDGSCHFRRLIFLHSRNVVQSEARLLPSLPLQGQKKRRKDKKKANPAEPPAAIDKSYLCCEHHKAMVAGLCLLGGPDPLPGTPLAVLVVGLGGGSLPLFIHDYFSQAHVAVVEIDPSMLEVAVGWFGFSQGDRLQVHVSDGLDYVAKLAAEAPAQYDAIMFDVDSKDLTVGMSCPPPAFVEKAFLQKVKTILKPEGVFVLNLVCRDAQLKESVLATLREVFPLLYARRITGEVNEILFCQPSPEARWDAAELGARAQALEGALRQPGRPWDSSYVLADMLQAIQIL
ncbi:eEF1A lysine and N-terminal methyltransferase isoform X2 [Indicator indicator]|uniref:eEF1A lysine and N-terminal methyltransferase isoform X2 n=1 Tax=Indicator indicator TaxID=1002788 RepID=UPI0023DEE894|nr:eEF1A lysine and N-terminal methyltransferase isoform X2 [Indicator indicator]